MLRAPHGARTKVKRPLLGRTDGLPLLLVEMLLAALESMSNWLKRLVYFRIVQHVKSQIKTRQLSVTRTPVKAPRQDFLHVRPVSLLSGGFSMCWPPKRRTYSRLRHSPIYGCSPKHIKPRNALRVVAVSWWLGKAVLSRELLLVRLPQLHNLCCTLLSP